jgi:hypothetical protein
MIERYRSPADPETLQDQARQDRTDFNERISEEAQGLRIKIAALETMVTLGSDAMQSCRDLLRLLAARSSIELEDSVTAMPDSFLR